jgi:hypothetical protein
MRRRSEWIRRSTALLVAIGAVWAVESLGRAEVGEDPRMGAIRVALRSAQARVETCRDRSEEELARLPAHMRTPRACEEVAVDYRLSLEVDGRQEFTGVLSHSGLRRTRPLVFDRLLLLPPGERRMRVELVPATPFAGDEAAALPRVQWTGAVTVEPGRIALLEVGHRTVVLK